MTSQAERSELLLGRYRLVRELGSGGFGTTWAAEDLEGGGEVAVKALDLSRVGDWKAVELFEREARTLEQLDHPNIPQYLDFVPVEADETGYLIQSLAPGRDLGTLLAEHGRFSDEQVESIAERTLEILAYLESLNPPVVHRDLKPGNLLLSEDGEVFLVDFGAVQDAAKRTSEGGSTVAGTFGYMAPEQLHGTASGRSDQHALGMTLIHLASGRRPSDFERRGLSIDFRSSVDLPESLEDFIERLVEPNPDDRYPSAAAALEVLRTEVDVRPNLGELPSGPSIAQTVRARERQAEQALIVAQKERRRAIAKREEVRAGRSDRVSVAMNYDEVHITVQPSRTVAIWSAVGAALFAFVNPGFAVAGGFPFLGRFWPIFSDAWPARWAVWGAFVFVLAALVVWWRTPRRNIRLSRQGFFGAYHRNAERPDTAGRFENFAVELFGREEGYPAETAEIRLTAADGTVVFDERFEELSARDIELLDDLPDDWIDGTQPPAHPPPTQEPIQEPGDLVDRREPGDAGNARDTAVPSIQEPGDLAEGEESHSIQEPGDLVDREESRRAGEARDAGEAESIEASEKATVDA